MSRLTPKHQLKQNPLRLVNFRGLGMLHICDGSALVLGDRYGAAIEILVPKYQNSPIISELIQAA